MKTVTAEYVRSVLSYDPASGIFTWVNSSRAGWNGKVAGCLHHHGYLTIKLCGRGYEAHRLAWLYCFGKWPTEIDHINGERADNRIENLRDVTRAMNVQNQRRAQAINSSGLLGVSWMKNNKKWIAQIQLDGVNHYLGLFEDKGEAHSAYLKAKKELHPYGEIAK